MGTDGDILEVQMGTDGDLSCRVLMGLVIYMDTIYCSRCRNYTESNSLKVVDTKTGRALIGECKICFTKKSKNVSKEFAENFANGIVLPSKRVVKDEEIMQLNNTLINNYEKLKQELENEREKNKDWSILTLKFGVNCLQDLDRHVNELMKENKELKKITSLQGECRKCLLNKDLNMKIVSLQKDNEDLRAGKLSYGEYRKEIKDLKDKNAILVAENNNLKEVDAIYKGLTDAAKSRLEELEKSDKKKDSEIKRLNRKLVETTPQNSFTSVPDNNVIPTPKNNVIPTTENNFSSKNNVIPRPKNNFTPTTENSSTSKNNFTPTTKNKFTPTSKNNFTPTTENSSTSTSKSNFTPTTKNNFELKSENNSTKYDFDQITSINKNLYASEIEKVKDNLVKISQLEKCKKNNEHVFIEGCEFGSDLSLVDHRIQNYNHTNEKLWLMIISK